MHPKAQTSWPGFEDECSMCLTTLLHTHFFFSLFEYPALQELCSPPSDENNHQLWPGACAQKGQLGVHGMGEADTGQAEDGQRQESNQRQWPEHTGP